MAATLLMHWSYHYVALSHQYYLLRMYDTMEDGSVTVIVLYIRTSAAHGHWLNHRYIMEIGCFLQKYPTYNKQKYMIISGCSKLSYKTRNYWCEKLKISISTIPFGSSFMVFFRFWSEIFNTFLASRKLLYWEDKMGNEALNSSAVLLT